MPELTPQDRLAFRWKRREPLIETWRGLDGGERDTALAFWRDASESDAWTFDQLAGLLRECRESSPRVPLLLADWGLAVAAGERRRPVRRGRSTDYAEDLHVMMAVVFRQARLGETVHAACQAVAETTNRSYEGVRAAYKRGDQWPLVCDNYAGNNHKE